MGKVQFLAAEKKVETESKPTTEPTSQPTLQQDEPTSQPTTLKVENVERIDKKKVTLQPIKKLVIKPENQPKNE
jgi:hypothetical protein